MSGDLRFSVSLDDLPEVEHEKKPAGAWDYVGGRANIFSGGIEVEHAAPEAEAVPEIEVVYEDPRRNREVEDASPPDEWQAKWAVERMAREEAVQAAYQRDLVLARTQEASQFDQHKAALEHEYASVHDALRAAQQRQAAANYNRNFEAAAEAGTEAAALVHRLKEYEGAYERIEEQKKEMLEAPINVPQTTAQVFEAGVASARLDPASEAWARHYQHKLMYDPDFYNNAIGTAQQIERDGYVAGSAEYFEALNGALGTDFDPHQQQDHQPAPRQSRQRGGVSKRTVAAPVSRSSGRSSQQSRIHLTDFDISEAKAMNIPLRQYADIKAKANKREGQLTQAEAGGRYHFRTSIDDHY
jgi:hypothetical protein